jgi:hypothetical protein
MKFQHLTFPSSTTLNPTHCLQSLLAWYIRSHHHNLLRLMLNMLPLRKITCPSKNSPPLYRQLTTTYQKNIWKTWEKYENKTKKYKHHICYISFFFLKYYIIFGDEPRFISIFSSNFLLAQAHFNDNPDPREV